MSGRRHLARGLARLFALARPLFPAPFGRIVPLACTLACLLVGPSQGRAAEGRTVLTRAMIERAGATRLSDVFLLIDDWAAITADGYTWKASPNGLSAFDLQRWIVMIDGQRADVYSFDAVHLNLLPIGVDQIDSVVVLSTPQLHDGLFTDVGLIQFCTSRPRPGATIHATVAGGNETRDPGPFAATPLQTPNVDRIGPDGSLTFGFGGDGWTVRANTTLQVHHFTDLAIRNRTFGAIGLPPSAVSSHGARSPAMEMLGIGMDAWPGTRRLTASLGADFRRGRIRLTPFLGFAEADQHFLYSEPFGRELPADLRYVHAGVDGVVPIRVRTMIRHRLQFTSNRLSPCENALDFDYDWESHRYLADGAIVRSSPSLISSVGGSVEWRTITTRYPLVDNEDVRGSLYASVDFGAGPGMRHRAGGTAVFAGETPAYKGFWDTKATFGARNEAGVAFAYAQRSFAENEDLWYWTGRGYGLLEDQGVAARIPREMPRSRTATVDLSWTFRPTRGPRARLSVLYRRFAEAYFETRRFSYDPLSCVPSSSTSVVPGNAGELGGAAFGLDHHFSPAVTVQCDFRVLRTLSGDAPFREAWDAVPDYRAAFRVTVAPREGFSMWAMAAYQSDSHWRAYDALEGAPCTVDGVTILYSSRIEPSTVVDIAIRKLFWRQRLAADFVCRNLFGETLRYHPVGASFDTTFYMQLALALHRDGSARCAGPERPGPESPGPGRPGQQRPGPERLDGRCVGRHD